ncbi:MAG: hypothetical protein INH41_12610 [Myxococcaceae bacterium]|nr:hypothetical protein [Myxococcaceae bacterium]MCA3013228.1 hypothetical protein [Myxococcaceae bacterium]
MTMLSLLLTSMVTAHTADCAAVRRALELATADALDTSTLKTLSTRYCSTPLSEACADTSTLWLMSLVAGATAETAALEAQRALTCSKPQPADVLLTWPDGSLLRSRGGTWTWDKGPMAKTSGAAASWFWPSGTLARSGNGTLFYPDGSLARSGNGAWSLPGGTSVQTESALVAAACAANATTCRAWLAYLPVTVGPARDAALVGLGWSTRR